MLRWSFLGISLFDMIEKILIMNVNLSLVERGFILKLISFIYACEVPTRENSDIYQVGLLQRKIFRKEQLKFILE